MSDNKPTGLYSEAALLEMGASMSKPKRGYGSLLCDVRYRLLEAAEKALDGGAYEIACDLLGAYEKVK